MNSFLIPTTLDLMSLNSLALAIETEALGEGTASYLETLQVCLERVDCCDEGLSQAISLHTRALESGNIEERARLLRTIAGLVRQPNFPLAKVWMLLPKTFTGSHRFQPRPPTKSQMQPVFAQGWEFAQGEAPLQGERGREESLQVQGDESIWGWLQKTRRDRQLESTLDHLFRKRRLDTRRFDELPSDLRATTIPKIIAVGLKNPKRLKIVLSALSNLSQEEQKLIQSELRNASFGKDPLGKKKSEAIKLLLFWVQTRGVTPSAEEVADLYGLSQEDFLMAIEFLQFKTGRRQESPLSLNGFLEYALASSSMGYAPQLYFPWSHKSLVRCVAALLAAKSHALAELAKTYFSYPDDSSDGTKEVDKIELIFENLPKEFLPQAIEALLDGWAQSTIARVKRREAANRANPYWAFDNPGGHDSVEPSRRCANLLVVLFNKIPASGRFSLAERMIHKVIQQATRTIDARHSLGKLAGKFLYKVSVFFKADEEKINCALLSVRIVLNFSKERFDPPLYLLARDIVSKLPDEARATFWQRLLLEPQDKTHAATLTDIFRNPPSGIFDDPNFENALIGLDKRLNQEGHVFSEVDALLVIRLIHAHWPIPIPIRQFSIAFQGILFLYQKNLPIEVYLVRTILAQENPLEYVEKIWEEAQGETHLFVMLVLLEDRQKGDPTNKKQNLVEDSFQRLSELERSRRKSDTGEHISQAKRTFLVRGILEAFERWDAIPSEKFFDLLPRLMDWLTPAIRRGLSEVKGVVGDVLTYYEMGLPFQSNIYSEWVIHPDRENYGRQLAAGLTFYRQGGTLPTNPSDTDLSLAYMALDRPDNLSLETFKQEMRRPKQPPKIFLPHSFSLDIASLEVSGAIHHQVDKGFIKRGWEKIPNLEGKEGLVTYLKMVLAHPKKRGLSPLREAIEIILREYAKKGVPYKSHLDVITNENAIAVAFKILQVLAHATDRNILSRPQIQSIMTHLVLGLAWDRPEAQGLRKSVAEYRRAIVSEKLFILVRQLQTFYNDTVGEILKPLEGLESPWIRKYREQLEKQRQKIVLEKGEKDEVMIYPWASQTAIYFGRVARDCNAEYTATRELYGDGAHPFQVDLMISQNRIVGLIYLKEATLDGHKVLVIALQPRSSWTINRAEFLEKVTSAFASVVREMGYEKLLFSASYGHLSNDMDLLSAIGKKGYPVWRTKESLKGNVLNGNQFLVIWERPSLPLVGGGVDLDDEGNPITHKDGPSTLTTKEEERPPQRIQVIDRTNERSSIFDVMRVLLERGFNPNQMATQAAQALGPMARRHLSQEAFAKFHRQFAEAAKRAGLGVGAAPLPEGIADFEQTVLLPPPPALVPYQVPPTALVRRTGLHPGLILERKSLAALLENENTVEIREDGVIPNVAREDLSPQDLFEFFQLVFQQGFHFRGFLHLIQIRGGDVSKLKGVVDEISQQLEDGLKALLNRDFALAHEHFSKSDDAIRKFQEILCLEARKVGLKIGPFGLITLVEDH